MYEAAVSRRSRSRWEPSRQRIQALHALCRIAARRGQQVADAPRAGDHAPGPEPQKDQGQHADGQPDVENSDGVKNAWKYASTAAQDKITAGLQQFSTPWNQAFANGAFATLSCPAWMLGYIKSQAGKPGKATWDVAALPGQASNWGGSWLGVPTASKNQAAAEALAEWLTAPAQQVTMWTSQQHFPSSQVAAANPAVADATSAYFSGAPIGQIFGKSAGELRRTPIGPYDTQIQQAFTTALTSIETKGTSPSSAFSDAQKNIKEIVGG